MDNNKVKSITVTGMFAALVFLATWLFHVQYGLNGGYIHFGDALVYTAAVLLPPPLAMAASAIGAGLSDLMSGAAIWAFPTVIIKSLCCLPFTAKSEKLINQRNIIALVIAGLTTIVGYYAASVVIFVMSEPVAAGIPISKTIALGLAAAVVDIPGNIIQATGSAACFIAIAAALDKTKLKNMIQLKRDK